MRSTFQRIPGYWYGVMAVCLLIVSISYTVNLAKREAGLLNRKAGQLQELQSLKAGLEADKLAIKNQFGEPIADVSSVAGASLQEHLVIDAPIRTPLAGGYERLQVQIGFKQLRWDQVRDFLSRMETNTPPWRVTDLEIEAGFSDLSGHVVVETLQRVELTEVAE